MADLGESQTLIFLYYPRTALSLVRHQVLQSEKLVFKYYLHPFSCDAVGWGSA